MSYSPLDFSSVSRRAFIQGVGGVFGATALAVGAGQGEANSILWYSASAPGPCETWAAMFKAATGVTVEVFRIGGVKLTQRIEQELKANQVKSSVMDFSTPGLMSDWARKGWIVKYESPEAKHYPADLRLEGYWTPINALTMSIAYNADHIKPDEAPKTWEDLLDPRWKGKMCMADAFYSGAAVHCFYAWQTALGKGFVERLAAQSILLRNGAGETTETLISGERPLAAMVLDYVVVEAIEKGANLYLVQPEIGIPSSYATIAIPKGAPNPDLGRRFVDFALSQNAQQRWQDKHGSLSLRDDVAPIKAERGRRQIRNIKLLASAGKDIENSFVNQRQLLEQWRTLFK